VLPDPARAPRRQYETSTNWDRFLQVHPAIPAAFYLPLAMWLLGRASAAAVPAGLLFVMGLALWTLLEYVIHRGILHYADLGAWWNLGLAQVHASHHEHPEDVSKVVISPARTAPGTALIYLLLRTLLPSAEAGGLLSGILVGYLGYETFHYLYHAPISLRWGWLVELRKYHARHHFETPDRRFGVTAPLWDFVFRTWS